MCSYLFFFLIDQEQPSRSSSSRLTPIPVEIQPRPLAHAQPVFLSQRQNKTRTDQLPVKIADQHTQRVKRLTHLQMAPHLIAREALHVHLFFDLLRSRNCRFNCLQNENNKSNEDKLKEGVTVKLLDSRSAPPSCSTAFRNWQCSSSVQNRLAFFGGRWPASSIETELDPFVRWPSLKSPARKKKKKKIR